LSALALALLLVDSEGGPEVYLNAVDKDQARILFDEAGKMVAASPELASRLEVVPSQARIVHEAGNGVIRATSADAPKQDGLNPSAIIWDELHRQKDRKLWDVFEFSQGAREQPLAIAITTAGEEESGVWFEQRSRSEKVNAGVIPDTSHLGVIYRASETDDLDSPETWRKANPSLGATITEDGFRREMLQAKQTPTAWGNFLRLKLNIVTRCDVAFIPLDRWDACAGSPAIECGDPIYAGLDLSETQDLTALVWISGTVADGFGARARFYLPEENIVELERKHGVPYRSWEKQGHLVLTPGNVVDYAFVRRDINELAAEHNLLQLLVDPYNATKLSIELKEQDGLPVQPIRQGFLSLSGPTKQLQRLLLGGKLRHGGNPILRWHASNAVAEQDAAGNLKLSKKKSKRKIDGMAALVNAIAAATTGSVDDEPSVYDERGIQFI
jgi:phage terminase large subunit-like protein